MATIAASAQTTKSGSSKSTAASRKPVAKKPVTVVKKPATTTPKPVGTPPDSVTKAQTASAPTSPAPAALVSSSAAVPAEAQPASQSVSKPAAQPVAAKKTPSPKGPTTGFRGRGYAGLKAGGNYTTLTNVGEDTKLGFSPGFHGGLVFVLPMSNSVAFQPEILYNRNSTKVTDTSLPSSVEATVSYNSLEIPLLFRFSFGDKTQFFFNVGPVGSYLLGSSYKINGTTQKIDMSSSKFKDRASYAAAGGLGVAFNSAGGQFFVEARGHYGLGDFANGFYKSEDSKPLFVTLSLGYLLAL